MNKENIENGSNNLIIFPAGNPITSPRWYAAYTKPRHEKKALEELTKKNIEVYLPLINETHQWSDRKKSVEVPLLKGYIFINIPLAESLYVLKTAAVIRFVMFNGRYAPIPNFQIDALKKAIEKKAKLKPTKYYKIGQLVKVSAGPLKGIVGKIQRPENEKKFVISLHAIQTSYTVQINPSLLKPFSEKNQKRIERLPLGLENDNETV